jgi:hypothetical protein
VTLSVTGLPSGVSTSFTPSSINGSGVSTLELITSPSVAAGTYMLQLTGVSGATTRSYPVTLVVDGTQASLPAPWQFDYIGPSIPSGSFSATLNNGVYSLTGQDCCIGGTADTVYFAHQTLAGDGAMTARLTSLGSSSQSGVMIRAGMNPGDSDQSISLSHNSSYQAQSRTAAGASAGPNASMVALISLPQWLRLIRQGTSVAVFASLDGVQWFPTAAPVTLALSGPAEIGLFVNGSATFDNVSISTAPFQISALPSAAYAMNGSTAAFTVSMQSFPAFAGSATLSVTGLPAGVSSAFSPATVSANSPATLTLTASNGAAQGSYPITITASNSGASQNTTVTLNVKPGFNVSVTPIAESSFFGTTVLPAAAYSLNGSSASFTISIAPDRPEMPSVSMSGLPSGVTYNLSSPTVSGSSPAILTLTAGSGVAQGSYPIAVTLTAGSSDTSFVTLNVMPGLNAPFTPPPFYTGVNPNAFNNYVDYRVNVTTVGGYAGTMYSDEADATNSTVYGSTAGFTGSNVRAINLDLNKSLANGTYLLQFPVSAPADGIQLNAYSVLTIGPDLTITTNSGGTFDVDAGASTGNPYQVSRFSSESQPIALSVAGLPAGASTSFSPNPMAASDTQSVVTVNTTPSTPAGTYTITVEGTTSDVSRTRKATLRVHSFSVAVSPSSRTILAGSNTTFTTTLSYGDVYSHSVTFSVTGLPTGANASFSPAALSAAGTTTLTVNTTSSVASGTYSLTIVGTSDTGQIQTTVASLVVNSVDFSISATTPPTIKAGSSTTSTITVTATGGFSGAVSLSASGLPGGATAGFSPTQLTGSGTSTLTVTTTGATLGGTYTVTITGTSGTLTHTKTITLTIQSFSLSASPTTVSLAAGASGTSVVTLTMTGGFSSAVTFGTTGLPSGASATFSPASSSASGSTTMTVTTTGAVAPNNYSFNITGTSGGLVQSIPATLSVTSGFSLSNSGNVTVTAAGSNGSTTITLTASAGLTGATTLSASGLPNNATASFSPSSITGSGTSTLTFMTPATVAGGAYTITVTGTNGSLTRTTTLTLTVKNFLLSISPTSLTVTHGGANVPATVTLTVAGGFNSSVSFSATGQQSGVTITFSPKSLSANGTTTMTVSASSSATRSTVTVTVKGTSGSLIQSTPLTLTVN